MPLPKELPYEFSTTNDEKQVFRNRYILDVRLGAGNFGTAYLVYDKEEEDSSNKKVMKQVCVGTLDPGETVDAMHEAKLLSRLQHKNIVQFHESFLNGQFFCIITEFCDGGDLDVKLNQYKEAGKIVEENQVISWLKQLLQALQYMHAKRILHRDLKTKNIFLKDNEMKIGDFGISRILMGTSDKASTFVGTPYYMSPEVLQHERYDEKCDMWSLGCVLYEMCCLKHAFEAQSLMAVMYKIVTGNIPELPKKYSLGLNLVLSKMLVRELPSRSTATEILQNTIFNGANSKHLEKSKLTPRERLRLKKQKAADEKFRRHQELAAQNLRENERRHRESVTRNFHHTSIEAASEGNKSKSRRRGSLKKLNNQNNNNNKAVSLSPKQNIDQGGENASVKKYGVVDSTSSVDYPKPKSKTLQPLHKPSQAVRPSATLPAGELEKHYDSDEGNATLKGTSEDIPYDPDSTVELAKSLAKEGYIPEDALLAETLYSLEEDFEIDSSDLDLESDLDPELPDEHVQLSDTEYREMLGLMEDALVLDESTVISEKKNTRTKVLAEGEKADSNPTSSFANNVIDGHIANMRKQCLNAMGQEVFDKAYLYLRNIWSNHQIPVAPDYTLAMQKLRDIVRDNNHCFLLEQLVYLENEKQGH